MNGLSNFLQAADIWSLGVTLFSLVYGKVPFHDENILALYNKIRTQELNIPDDSDISPELKDLMRRMLVKNPLERINLEEIKEHDYDLTNTKCTISGWGGLNRSSLNSWLGYLCQPRILQFAKQNIWSQQDCNHGYQDPGFNTVFYPEYGTDGSQLCANAKDPQNHPQGAC